MRSLDLGAWFSQAVQKARGGEVWGSQNVLLGPSVGMCPRKCPALLLRCCGSGWVDAVHKSQPPLLIPPGNLSPPKQATQKHTCFSFFFAFFFLTDAGDGDS